MLPTDLRKALTAAPRAKALWSDLTTVARRDWIQWIESAKQAATRTRRIDNTCDMLLSGKRRVCCFDRSEIYSKGLSAPRRRTDRRIDRRTAEVELESPRAEPHGSRAKRLSRAGETRSCVLGGFCGCVSASVR